MSSSSSVLFQLCCTWAFNARHCTTLAQYTLNIAQYTLNSTALPVKHAADVLPCYTAPTLSNTATLLHFCTSTLLHFYTATLLHFYTSTLLLFCPLLLHLQCPTAATCSQYFAGTLSMEILWQFEQLPLFPSLCLRLRTCPTHLNRWKWIKFFRKSIPCDGSDCEGETYLARTLPGLLRLHPPHFNHGFHRRRISQRPRWSSPWRSDQRWLKRKIGEICKFNLSKILCKHLHFFDDYMFLMTKCPCLSQVPWWLNYPRYLATKKQFGLRPQFTELIMLCKPCRWHKSFDRQ